MLSFCSLYLPNPGRRQRFGCWAIGLQPLLKALQAAHPFEAAIPLGVLDLQNRKQSLQHSSAPSVAHRPTSLDSGLVRPHHLNCSDSSPCMLKSKCGGPQGPSLVGGRPHCGYPLEDTEMDRVHSVERQQPAFPGTSGRAPRTEAEGPCLCLRCWACGLSKVLSLSLG